MASIDTGTVDIIALFECLRVCAIYAKVGASPFGPGCWLRRSPEAGSSPLRAAIPDASRESGARERVQAIVLGALRHWIERRRQVRRGWQADARRLVWHDEPGAYYEAQRLAARARASGQTGEFIHWAKVAAEVARISPRAKMDLAVVQAIVDDEMRRGRVSRSDDD